MLVMVKRYRRQMSVFESVSAGQQHTCGLHTDGDRDLLGRKLSWCNSLRLLTLFSQYPLDGSTQLWTLRADGTAVCWGKKL